MPNSFSVRYILLPMIPLLGAIVSTAVSVLFGSYWYLLLIGTASIFFILAKPRPEDQFDDKKELTQERMEELVESCFPEVIFSDGKRDKS